MKKSILVIAALGLTYAGIAQDKYVTSALTNLNSKNLEEAKADIDRAMNSPETKEKPKALFAKAKIYLSMQMDKKYEAGKPYRDGMQALLKLVEIKPDYEKEDVNPVLFYGAILYYNDGIAAYNDKKYTESMDLLKNTVKIHNLGGGHRFDKLLEGKAAKQLDTVSSNAETQMARCAYAQGNNEEVIKLINNIKANPIGQTKDNYIILLESYEKYNKDNNNKLSAEELAATAEARKAYPNDPNIKNMEMNTLMKTGKTGDLLKKMEEDVAKDANNADLNFNLGILYQTMATAGKDGKKPAGAADNLAKAETSLSRAVKLAPENGSYNHALGTLYYNQGFDLNEEMNTITGSSDADNKRFEDLKKKRDGFFAKAQVPYEKAAAIYGARPSVEGNDRDNYHSVLLGLKQIYIVLDDKTGKLKGITDKLTTMEN